jgi:methylphosphotriester-DNA--protein-cysteine methyltransferase
VQNHFLHATGLTPSTARQIERAHVAAALLERGVPVLDAVHEAAYFDQPHMTRSLKRFLGQTPAQIARGDAHVCAIAHLYKTSLGALS